MNKKIIKNKFDWWVLLRLVFFVILSSVISSMLRIFVEAVIEGKQGAPDFVTIPFMVYAFCVIFVYGLGYVIFGHKIPVKNTILRAFTYRMFIVFSGYLPNILAMLGGDGEIITDSLSVGIVVVDIISGMLEGLILGLLMKKYFAEKTEVIYHSSRKKIIVSCVAVGVLFFTLNFVADIVTGVIDDSWRLCSILKVSQEKEIMFNVVFMFFMFIAGAIQPIWYRLCLNEDASALSMIVFALEIAAFVWLPNVLIMAFFGTSAVKTITYGVAYVIMIVVCALLYRKINNKTQNKIGEK